MHYDPERHHRRSIRLKGYDYAHVGAYFVTICVWQRECLFGDVAGGVVALSAAGGLVQQAWVDLPARYVGVSLDAFVVMPNHVHGILFIAGLEADDDRREEPAPGTDSGRHEEGATSSAPTLGQIVRAYKSLSAVAVNRHLGRSERPVWQRNYYEHIIRGEDALNDIRLYITRNPPCWDKDAENPANVRPNDIAHL